VERGNLISNGGNPTLYSRLLVWEDVNLEVGRRLEDIPNPMTQQDLHELARKGDSKAISALLNQQLKSWGVRSKVVTKQRCLHVILEADDNVPDRPSCLEIVRVKVVNWEVEGVDRVRVYGRKTGNSAAAWQQEFAVAVGGYSNLLFSQSQGATGSPEPEGGAEEGSAAKSPSSTSHGPSQMGPVLKGILLIVVVLLAVGAYFLLQQSQSDESDTTQEQLIIKS